MTDQLQPTPLGPTIVTAPEPSPGFAPGEPHLDARFAEVERLFESFFNRGLFPEPGCDHGLPQPLGGGCAVPGHDPGADIDPGMSPGAHGYIIPGSVTSDDANHAF
jgi:hypothetical protein